MNLMRKFRKQWLIFLLPILLCGCRGSLAPPIPLFTNQFTPFVDFYGYNRSEITTFRGYLYRDSLLIDSCYFDYKFNRQDAYGERNSKYKATLLCFYNSEIAPLDSITYTDTLFIHTGHKIHKVYNMYYARYRKYLATWPYSLVYTVDGIETCENEFQILDKNDDYWTPASSYKLLTKDFTPLISFDNYKRDEITTFKGYLYRDNYIVDSCHFEYSGKGVGKYATRIITKLHFYNSEMPPLDSIAYTDTLFMHIGDNIHKIYNIYNVLERKKMNSDGSPYSRKYTIDGIKTENYPILYKNGAIRIFYNLIPYRHEL